MGTTFKQRGVPPNRVARAPDLRLHAYVWLSPPQLAWIAKSAAMRKRAIPRATMDPGAVSIRREPGNEKIGVGVRATPGTLSSGLQFRSAWERCNEAGAPSTAVRAAIREIAADNGVSAAAARALFDALAAGGTMAQFSHPELGGMGPWSLPRYADDWRYVQS